MGFLGASENCGDGMVVVVVVDCGDDWMLVGVVVE